MVPTTLDSSRVFHEFQVHFLFQTTHVFKYSSSILIYPYRLLSLSIKFSTLLKSVLIQVGFQTTAFLYPTWIRTLFISIYLHSSAIPNNSLLITVSALTKALPIICTSKFQAWWWQIARDKLKSFPSVIHWHLRAFLYVEHVIRWVFEPT